MIRVISVDLNDRQGVVVIEADSQEEARSMSARQAALTKAAQAGLPRPGISNNEAPYPVDNDGQTDDDLMQGRRPVAGYRCAFTVTAGL